MDNGQTPTAPKMKIQTPHTISRRSLLKGVIASAVLLSSTSLTPAAAAEGTDSFAFNYDSFSARMRDVAAAPYAPPKLISSAFYEGLDYDGHRRVQFNTKRAVWAEQDHGYQVHVFPPGWLFKETVSLFEVNEGQARPMNFTGADFNFYFDEDQKSQAETAEFPGVAGFRLNHPINDPDRADELVSFLGASYFRALGRDNIYGLSARGLLINSWRDGPEEFPRFSEFYLERPQNSDSITIYAALESQSVAGAYRFVIRPAGENRQETVMDVTARLYFRADIAELGIAPLTSMFLFGAANHISFDDYRPQVHDSTGLLVEPSDGTVIWRPLNNTKTLGNTYLADKAIRSFGLYQRGRDFETYQDAGAHYERRPSLKVEPISNWGEGTIRLIEIPARYEADDNIGAFWIPAGAITAGSSREFSYRLTWGDLNAEEHSTLAYVAETRAGMGGVSGVENATALRKFVIDFAGGRLPDLEPDTEFNVLVTNSAGSIVSTTFSRIDANEHWRLVIDIDTADQPLIELKASIALGNEPITETWIYQWRGIE